MLFSSCINNFILLNEKRVYFISTDNGSSMSLPQSDYVSCITGRTVSKKLKNKSVFLFRFIRYITNNTEYILSCLYIIHKRHKFLLVSVLAFICTLNRTKYSSSTENFTTFCKVHCYLRALYRHSFHVIHHLY